MKTQDLRKKSHRDLAKLITELESELRQFRFGMSGGHSKNVRASRAVRKDVARIKTVIREGTYAK